MAAVGSEVATAEAKAVATEAAATVEGSVVEVTAAAPVAAREGAEAAAEVEAGEAVLIPGADSPESRYPARRWQTLTGRLRLGTRHRLQAARVLQPPN